MKKTKVLVLGNSPQINQIEFDLLQDDVITLGINRIWLKYIPNYFFFHDLVISNELHASPEDLAKLIQHSTIFSSDWIKKNIKTLFLSGQKFIQDQRLDSFQIQQVYRFNSFQKT